MKFCIIKKLRQQTAATLQFQYFIPVLTYFFFLFSQHLLLLYRKFNTCICAFHLKQACHIFSFYKKKCIAGKIQMISLFCNIASTDSIKAHFELNGLHNNWRVHPVPSKGGPHPATRIPPRVWSLERKRKWSLQNNKNKLTCKKDTELHKTFLVRGSIEK